MNQAQKNILKILYNRQKGGIKMSDLLEIINSPELMEKELKLFNHKKERQNE